MIVAIPSKGRAGLVFTHEVLPSARVYVPALEAAAYRTMGTTNVTEVPDDVLGITRTRNWILRHTDDDRVVMIDDDLKTCGWHKLGERTSMVVKLRERAWLDEFRKVFELTEQLGYRIWGVSTAGATRDCWPCHPFRWRSYVTASCMGIINDGRTYFDEDYPVKEDYELCLRCIKEDGGIVSAQYLFWVNAHWSDEGGCRTYRTDAMERDCIKRLRRAYPGMVRVAKRVNSQYCLEVVA